MKEYCNKCFRRIITGAEHQDWCPNSIDLFNENVRDNPNPDIFSQMFKEKEAGGNNSHND